MSAVEKIKEIVSSEGHECFVEISREGKVVCRIDGSPYSPFAAADKFILGGWATIWSDR
jgi:hypothetical protein